MIYYYNLIHNNINRLIKSFKQNGIDHYNNNISIKQCSPESLIEIDIIDDNYMNHNFFQRYKIIIIILIIIISLIIIIVIILLSILLKSSNNELKRISINTSSNILIEGDNEIMIIFELNYNDNDNNILIKLNIIENNNITLDDYNISNKFIVLNNNDIKSTQISLSVINDNLIENNEYLIIKPVFDDVDLNDIIFIPSSITIYFQDELTNISFTTTSSLDSNILIEGDSSIINITFTNSLSTPISEPIEIELDITGGNSTINDYTITPNMIILNNMMNSNNFTITPNNDNLIENNESIIITPRIINNASVIFNPISLSFIIQDEITMISLTKSSSSNVLYENGESITITIEIISRPISEPIEIELNESVVGITNNDYTITLDVNMITLNDDSSSINFMILNNEMESDINGILTITPQVINNANVMINPTNLSFIINDESNQLMINLDDNNILIEGGYSININISRLASIDSTITLSTVISLIISGSAMYNDDYIILDNDNNELMNNSMIELNNYKQSIDIDILANDDIIDDNNEQLIITFTSSNQLVTFTSSNQLTFIIKEGELNGEFIVISFITPYRFGVNENLPFGITLHSGDGKVYMVGQDCGCLYTLNIITGIATRVIDNDDPIVGFGDSDDSSPVGEIFPNGLASINNILYMLGDYTNRLYTLNISNGEAIRVGSATYFGVDDDEPTGLTNINGELYMLGDWNDKLYRLNKLTGVATGIGRATGFNVREFSPAGLAYINNQLYMSGNTNNKLYRLDKLTGIATEITDSPDRFGVIENNPGGLTNINGQLYMIGRTNDVLFKIDEETGRATLFNNDYIFGFPYQERYPTGLTNVNGQLYMVGESVGVLYTLNKDTGKISRVGGAALFGTSTPQERKPKGLASIDNNLYMLGDSCKCLYQFNRLTTGDMSLTGAVTRVEMITNFGITKANTDDPDESPRGLASIENDLYMLGNTSNCLYKFDRSTTGDMSLTGTVTRVGSSTNFGVNEVEPTGLTNIGNQLYMVGRTNHKLYKLNKDTGVATVVNDMIDLFGIVEEDKPWGLASIDNTIYMVSDKGFYRSIRELK